MKERPVVFRYLRSEMKPHFWAVLHGDIQIAEVHTELYAKKIVAALNRSDILDAALKTAFTAMSVASCINAVRAEYDFEPAIQKARAALLPPSS